MQTFVYLGPEGTFTEQALKQLHPEGDHIPVSSVNVALDTVAKGKADAAVVPIENSVEGGVTATLDAIAASKGLQIIDETLVEVKFNLVSELPLKEIKTISTHSHAWAQCRNWIEDQGLEVDYIPAGSTAAAAKALGTGTFDAAICSPQAAKDLGLTVVAEDIGQHAQAVTRFVLISAPENEPKSTGHDKTTLVLPLPEDHPGALMEILTMFADHDINLSRIESRPRGDELGKYVFSIDAGGHVQDGNMKAVLKGLTEFSPGLKYLGSYPRAV